MCLIFIFRQGNFDPNHQQVSSLQASQEKAPEPPNKQLPKMEDGQNYMPATANTDRVSYDGYNWRKYGQKQVKGSKYPTSYYKCTHPSCRASKKVERTLDGEIADIVYKGEHNHLKPQSIERNTSNFSQGLVSDNNIDEFRTVVTEAGIMIWERVERVQVMMSNPPTDSTEIVEDGFRWRKYGQKFVEGNPYPRSYCKCTNLNCKVKKRVERSIDDPTSFVTIYEGRHNHEMPTDQPNPTPSE